MQLKRRLVVLKSRRRSLYVIGMTETRIRSRYKIFVNNSPPVNIKGSKKKAIMMFTTRPTEEPFIRLDILGHRLNTRRDNTYCIVRLKSGRLVAISLLFDMLK